MRGQAHRVGPHHGDPPRPQRLPHLLPPPWHRSLLIIIAIMDNNINIYIVIINIFPMYFLSLGIVAFYNHDCNYNGS